MKTFSNARVGKMSYHSTMTKPKELILKVTIVVRIKIYPRIVAIVMRMILPSDCNAQLCTPQG